MKQVNQPLENPFKPEEKRKKDYTFRFIENIKQDLSLESQFFTLNGLLSFPGNGIDFIDGAEQAREDYDSFKSLVDTHLVACRMDEIRTAQRNEILADSDEYEQKENPNYLERYGAIPKTQKEVGS